MIFDDESTEGEDDGGVNVMIDFTQKVNFVRMMGNVLTPMRLTIRAEVIPSPTALDIDFDISFAKIKFWFESVVSRCVVFCRNNTTALQMFIDEDGKSIVVNHLMITPSEPTDEHLGAIFQSKMQALSNGTMTFGLMRVNSESQTGLVWSYVGDWEVDLPPMQEWFSTTPYYFDSPWWTRNDTSTIDMIGKGVTNFSEIPNWAYTLDFIDDAIRPRNSEPVSTAESSASSVEGVVIRGAFRPKVIDGEGE